MSLNVDLHGCVANKDQLWNVTATYDDKPLLLSNYTITAYLKASRTASDGSGTSFTTSSGLTVVENYAGKFTWAVPRADVAAAGTLWYRIDIEDGASRIYTLLYGNMFLISA